MLRNTPHGPVAQLGLRRPHDGQREILVSPARFVVVFAGRRFGKTDLDIEQILVGTEERPGAVRCPGALFFWIGLSWRAASMRRAWRLLKRACSGWCEIREAEKEIKLPNGAELWMRTAENAEAVSGEGVRGAVFDEFTLAGDRLWPEHLRPCLADQRGWCVFSGVPKGRNWGWRLWCNEQNGIPGWRSFSMPTARKACGTLCYFGAAS